MTSPSEPWYLHIPLVKRVQANLFVQRVMKKMRSDTNLGDLLRYSGIIYVAGIISTLLTIVQQLTTASWLGAETYGMFATVMGSSLLIMLLIDIRTWELGSKLLTRPILDKNYAEISGIFTWLVMLDLLSGILGALVMLGLANWIATDMLDSGALTEYVRIYAISIPFHMFALGVANTIIRLYDYFSWLAAKSIAYALLRLVLISGAAMLDLGLEGVIVGAIIGELLNALALLLMTFIILRRETGGAPLIRLHRPIAFAEGLRLIPGLWLGATLKGLQLQSLIPLMALMTTQAQVGSVRLGLDISGFVMRLTDPIAIVLTPLVFKSYEKDSRPEFRKFIRQATILMGLIVLPFILGFFILGPFVLPRLLKDEFENITIVAGLLLIGYGYNIVFIWIRPVIVATGRINTQNVVSLILTGVFIGAMMLMIPPYGAVGAALSMAGFLIAYATFSLWIANEGIKHDTGISAPSA